MKMIVVALALVALAAAGPVPEASVDGTYKILRSEFQPKENGGYDFTYETENKIQREETGELRTIVDEENKPHEVVVVRGSFSYINDKGEPEVMQYWADESGFHAEGSSVPKNVDAATRR